MASQMLIRDQCSVSAVWEKKTRACLRTERRTHQEEMSDGGQGWARGCHSAIWKFSKHDRWPLELHWEGESAMDGTVFFFLYLLIIIVFFIGFRKCHVSCCNVVYIGTPWETMLGHHDHWVCCFHLHNVLAGLGDFLFFLQYYKCNVTAHKALGWKLHSQCLMFGCGEHLAASYEEEEEGLMKTAALLTCWSSWELSLFKKLNVCGFGLKNGIKVALPQFQTLKQNRNS